MQHAIDTLQVQGAAPDIPTMARELAVSHVIVGSVRKSGGRIRITVKLIDAKTSKHLWAERYDRKVKDIFALQDEVRGKIVAALAVELAAGEEQWIALKGTESVEAYDLLMKGRYQASSFTREGNSEAVRLYEEALEIDPYYAEAYARMANMYDIRSLAGWSDDIERDTGKAMKLAQRAIAIEQNNPFFHWTMARVYSRIRTDGMDNLLNSVRSLERAIELDPNYADAYAYMSHLFVGIGRLDDALAMIQSAIMLNPQYPFWYIRNRGFAHYMEDDYRAAISDLEKAVEQNPTASLSRWWLAAAYAQAGQIDDAVWQTEELRALGSQLTIQDILETSMIHHPQYLDRLTAGLRKAGVPK